MLNFTVGPVSIPDYIKTMGAAGVPYFRTPDFSALMKESDVNLRALLNAPEGARAVFLTGSGTFAMEAVVMNSLKPGEDRALVINGGTFGARFSKICEVHGICHTDIMLKPGSALSEQTLESYAGAGCTALLVNLCETSTGVLYDIDMLSDFCRRHGMLLIIDAVSAFLADRIDMSASGAAAVITGSQKALALAPGVSMAVLSEELTVKIKANSVSSLYMDLKPALEDAERGQTPFTPAVGLLIQLNARLHELKLKGARQVCDEIHALASDFRGKLAALGLGFENFSESPAGAVTAVYCSCGGAYGIFETLMNEYGIWICPNGGELKNSVFRVGHLGALTVSDNDTLIAAFADMKKRGLIR